MSKCEYENKGKCTLNECMYGDFLDEDDSRFHTGKYCLCDDIEDYKDCTDEWNKYYYDTRL